MMRKAIARSAILAGRAALLGSEATARPAAVGTASVFKAFYNAVSVPGSAYHGSNTNCAYCDDEPHNAPEACLQ